MILRYVAKYCLFFFNAVGRHVYLTPSVPVCALIHHVEKATGPCATRMARRGSNTQFTAYKARRYIRRGVGECHRPRQVRDFPTSVKPPQCEQMGLGGRFRADPWGRRPDATRRQALLLISNVASVRAFAWHASCCASSTHTQHRSGNDTQHVLTAEENKEKLHENGLVNL